MKRILFLGLLLLGIGSFAFSQVTGRGNFMLGGTVGISTAQSKITQTTSAGESQDKSPTSSQISFAPSVGYFLLDRTAVGIRMDFTRSAVREQQADKVLDSDLLFGPFGRYYLPAGKDLALFIDGGFGFGNSNDQQYFGEVSQRINTNIFAVGIGPGFTVFSEHGLGIEALLKYNFARSRFDTTVGGVSQEVITHTNQVDLALGLQLYFGGMKKLESPKYF